MHIPPHEAAKEIEYYFTDLANPKLAAKFQSFYKIGEYHALGITAPVVRSLSSKTFRKIVNSDRSQILDACDHLAGMGPMEYKTVAFDWVRRLKPKLDENNFALLEDWVQTKLTNWSDCDDLCTHALGELLLRQPHLLKQVKPWSRSGNWVVRRASAVALIHGARKGHFLNETLTVSKQLLNDKEDLVLKGYGWLLKEASRMFPQEILEFVKTHQAKMPRVALRFAIEKYPKEVRQEILSPVNMPVDEVS